MPPGADPGGDPGGPSRERDDAYAVHPRQVAAGRQAFVICPLIEENDKLGVRSAAAEYERLRDQVFPDLRVELLHGRMPAREKEERMASLRLRRGGPARGTSVVEVGVDVPNATIMVIEGPSASASPSCTSSEGASGAASTGPTAYVQDGEEAVALARSEEPELAILDVKMPKLDGIEAARRILEERPRVPIVMLTAYGQQELVARAVEAGVFGYLVKPFREQALLPAIAAARARHEELQALRAEAESLADALAARKVIEQAKGLLMEREQLTEQEAFARLPKASQASGRPLKAIAEAVVVTLTGGRGVTRAEHRNAALVRRVFAAFGRDPKAIAAAYPATSRGACRATRHVRRYHGRVEVMEFLRRTGLETGGTYRSASTRCS